MLNRILGVISFLVFGFISIGAQNALAVSSSGVPVRRVYASSPVLTWQHAELIASSVKGIKGVQVNNTGAHNIQLAFGASGSEVDQMLVGGNQDTGFLPLSAGYATRLSVISLDGPNESGELDVSVFYN